MRCNNIYFSSLKANYKVSPFIKRAIFFPLDIFIVSILEFKSWRVFLLSVEVISNKSILSVINLVTFAIFNVFSKVSPVNNQVLILADLKDLNNLGTP